MKKILTVILISLFVLFCFSCTTDNVTNDKGDTYIISFDSGYQTSVELENKTVFYGDKVTDLPFIERQGYVFVCWKDLSTNTVYKEGSVFKQNKNISLTAIWERKTFTIHLFLSCEVIKQYNDGKGNIEERKQNVSCKYHGTDTPKDLTFYYGDVISGLDDAEIKSTAQTGDKEFYFDRWIFMDGSGTVFEVQNGALLNDETFNGALRNISAFTIKVDCKPTYQVNV